MAPEMHVLLSPPNQPPPLDRNELEGQEIRCRTSLFNRRAVRRNNPPSTGRGVCTGLHVFYMLIKMKWTSGKDITLLWGTSWHKRWQIPLPPTPPPSALMCNKPGMLLSLLSPAKKWGLRDEMKPIPLPKVYVMTLQRPAGSRRGDTKSRVGGNVYPGNKDCDNCGPFELERL